METFKRKAQVAGVILLPLLLSACLDLQIIEDVKNPERYFQRAYRQIEEIHRDFPNREGRPHHIHFLIYDDSDHDLIKMAVPLWLVDGCIDLGREVAEIDDDFDFGDRYDFDLRGIKDLGQIGPGLLVEVDDEEGKILIWLE